MQTKKVDFRMVHMPYCLFMITKNVYQLRNREYKLLGDSKESSVIGPVIKELPDEIKLQLSISNKLPMGHICFYDDSCIPTHSQENMDAYMAKLKVLYSLDMQVTLVLKEDERK